MIGTVCIAAAVLGGSPMHYNAAAIRDCFTKRFHSIDIQHRRFCINSMHGSEANR